MGAEDLLCEAVSGVEPELRGTPDGVQNVRYDKMVGIYVV